METSSIVLYVLAFAVILILTARARHIHRHKTHKITIQKESLAKQIDKMQGHEFDEWLNNLFISKGYYVRDLPKSRDFGIDLIVTDKKGATIGIQAKRYKGKVGISAVQECYTGTDYYGCHIPMIITNSHFTPAAKKVSKRLGVLLMDRERLLEFAVNHYEPTDTKVLQ